MDTVFPTCVGRQRRKRSYADATLLPEDKTRHAAEVTCGASMKNLEGDFF